MEVIKTRIIWAFSLLFLDRLENSLTGSFELLGPLPLLSIIISLATGKI
jgi:hypothetical protein